MAVTEEARSTGNKQEAAVFAQHQFAHFDFIDPPVAIIVALAQEVGHELIIEGFEA